MLFFIMIPSLKLLLWFEIPVADGSVSIHIRRKTFSHGFPIHEKSPPGPMYAKLKDHSSSALTVIPLAFISSNALDVVSGATPLQSPSMTVTLNPASAASTAVAFTQ